MSYYYHLIEKNPAPVWNEEEYVPGDFVQTEPGVYAYASVEQNPPIMSRPEMDGAVLIGTWNPDGTYLVFDEGLYTKYRPLGNKEGKATKNLDYTKFAGTAQRMVGDINASDVVLRLYPQENAPFAVEIRHKYYDTPATPASTGWGFRSEVLGGAASRDITARSMGAYDDEEYTEVLWPAIGAYQLGESDWQVDDEGNPLEVYYLDSWDGYRVEEKRDWYVVLLWASIWEGTATLRKEEDSVQFLFWKENQGSDPEPWVQPDGAGGPNFPYSIGDVVTHNGSTWESTHNDNVWEPGVFGWTANGR